MWALEGPQGLTCEHAALVLKPPRLASPYLKKINGVLTLDGLFYLIQHEVEKLIIALQNARYCVVMTHLAQTEERTRVNTHPLCRP